MSLGLTRTPAEIHWSKEATVQASGKWQYSLPGGGGGGTGVLTECLRVDVMLEGVSTEDQHTKTRAQLCSV